VLARQEGGGGGGGGGREAFDNRGTLNSKR